MKIHRISPNGLETLIRAHLAGRTGHIRTCETRQLCRFLRDDDGSLSGILLNIAGILRYNIALSERNNRAAVPAIEFSLRKRGKQLHLVLCNIRFFCIPPLFILDSDKNKKISQCIFIKSIQKKSTQFADVQHFIHSIQFL
ncbi:hypothetical protein ACNM69_002029 [Escherichia coli]